MCERDILSTPVHVTWYYHFSALYLWMWNYFQTAFNYPINHETGYKEIWLQNNLTYSKIYEGVQIK